MSKICRGVMLAPVDEAVGSSNNCASAVTSTLPSTVPTSSVTSKVTVRLTVSSTLSKVRVANPEVETDKE